MYWTELKNQYLIRLEAGEKIVETLLGFASEMEIGIASIQGIGGICGLNYGIFDNSNKSYQMEQYKGFAELISLNGSISWHQSKPYAHLHFAAITTNQKYISGHLFDGNAAITVELFLNYFEKKIERKFDERAGFKVLQLANRFKG